MLSPRLYTNFTSSTHPPQTTRSAGTDAREPCDLDEAGGHLFEEVGEDLRGAVLGEVPYHFRGGISDVGQLRKVLHLARRVAQSGDRLGGSPVSEDAVVGLVFDLHERRDRLQSPGYVRVLQGNLLAITLRAHFAGSLQ